MGYMFIIGLRHLDERRFTPSVAVASVCISGSSLEYIASLFHRIITPLTPRGTTISR
jgi:hypothetical protein